MILPRYGRIRLLWLGLFACLAVATSSVSNAQEDDASLFSGCDNDTRAPSGETTARPAPVVDRFTERAFASFTMDDVERGVAGDLDSLCWSRLDGLWRAETPIVLAEGQVDESLWGASGPELMKLAN